MVTKVDSNGKTVNCRVLNFWYCFFIYWFQWYFPNFLFIFLFNFVFNFVILWLHYILNFKFGNTDIWMKLSLKQVLYSLNKLAFIWYECFSCCNLISILISIFFNHFNLGNLSIIHPWLIPYNILVGIVIGLISISVLVVHTRDNLGL